MELRRKLRSPFEVAGMRLGLALVPRLSRRAVLRLSRILGGAAFAAGGRLRRVGEANLALALGATHPASALEAILRRSYCTSAQIMLDVLWFTREPQRRIPDGLTIDPGLDRMLKGPAQILITGHHGNWETLGQAVSLAGYPITSVATPLANPAVDRLLVRARGLSGQEIVPREGALLRLIRRLRRGGKTALLLDQNTLPDEGGLFVDFFGLPVPVSQAPALLALRTGAKIGFGWALPGPDGRYTGVTGGVIDPKAYGERPGPEAVAELTRAITRRLEQAVRDWPEHWIWMYKRWKYIPPDHSADGYPFYAKRWQPKPPGVGGRG